MERSYLSPLKEKLAHPGFKKYAQNALWMFGSKAISMGISFLATLYIARNLGPSNYGQLSYAVSLISLFSFASSLGIDNVLFRDLIAHPEKRNAYMGTAFFLKLAGGIVAAIITASFAFFVAMDDVSRTLILILSGTFLLAPFQIIALDFQARAETKYVSIVAMSITFILNVLKIIVIASGKGVIYLALVLLLEPVLYAVFYVGSYFGRMKATLLSWTFNARCAKILIAYGWPMIIMSAISMVYSRIDQVLIKHLMDASAVGLYDSAVRIAELWIFVPSILVTVLYPPIIHARHTSESQYNKRLGAFALFLFALAVAIAAPVTVLAPLIMHILYGNAFTGGTIVLQVYVWAGIGTFLGILITQYLVTENHRKIIAFMAIIPTICNVALNLIWIPRFGLEGAAYATLVSYSLLPLSPMVFKDMRDRVRAVYHSLM